MRLSSPIQPIRVWPATQPGWIGTSIIFSVALNLAAADPPELPVSPEKALATIHVPEGFTVELVAAEPLVMDPVAIAWGTNGRLWVAEMADYPSGMDGKGKPGGRIRFLEDTNHDSKYDRSTIFVEGLNFPTGVLPWKDGVLITAAPEIIYASDTDGDGKADKQEVLFRGFHEGNQQLRVNGLQRGLDNWIYCASGSHHAGYGKDSRIESTRTGESITLGSLDFRFKPDTGELEPQSGPTQFGRNRDEWGNWFGTMNSHPIWHYVLQDSWLRRNPFLKPPDPRRQLVLPRNPRVYPAKAPQKRYHSFEQTGRFTSACGGMIYRDELLYPRDGRMHAFTCEPFHNLVQHNVVEEAGFSFRGYRDESEGTIDFFASTDRWCRPVTVRTGPDGALWVVDMYRYIIEHAQWLPETGKKELAPFLRSGDDRGRIYRVYRTSQPPREFPVLEGKSNDDLVETFESPNGPVRDLAQELLVKNAANNADTVALLQATGAAGAPFSRLHALWTLEGMGHLRSSDLIAALKDKSPGLRRNAIRLAGEFAPGETELVSALSALDSDPGAHVRLQLAAALGDWPEDGQAAEALARLAVQDAGDPHFDATVLSSAGPGNLLTLIDATLSADSGAAAAGDLAGRLLALSVALGKNEVTLGGLKQVLSKDPDAGFDVWQYGMISGLFDALKQHDSSIEKLATNENSVIDEIGKLTARARKAAQDSDAPVALRAAAVRLMARSTSEKERRNDLELLGGLLVPATPPALQSAAIAHLASLNDSAAGAALLTGWKSHGPDVRAEILGVIPSRREWIASLLDELEAGKIPPGHIGPFVQQNLRRGADKGGRERLAKIFADSATGTQGRKEVVAAWKPALDLEGNRKNGAEIFKLACASCHQLDGVGLDIGPSLASLSDRRPIALFTAILDPNAQLDGRYTTYVASTKDDRSLVGFLAAESGNSITLKGADNVEHQVLRSDLKSLESTGLSLMPEGLEAAMDHQKLADLIAYLAKAGLPEN